MIYKESTNRWLVTGTGYRALVGSFSCMNSHVDQQFVSGIEWLVISLAVPPEAGEIFAFTLVDMALLDMFHQLIATVECVIAFDPLALHNLGTRDREEGLCTVYTVLILAIKVGGEGRGSDRVKGRWRGEMERGRWRDRDGEREGEMER